VKIHPIEHKWYGWIADRPDFRDLKFNRPLPKADLPESVNLESKCPLIVDQGALGSCTANAIAGALHFDALKQSLKDADPVSRLFIYYNERVIEGTVGTDSGAQIRDGIKSVAQIGAPPETDWPYVISHFTKKPSAKAFKDAKKHLALKYESVAQDLDAMQGTLAAGFPIVFGFSVYQSFESPDVAKTGIVPLPKNSEQLLGGHAVMAVGYDNATERFRVRNSWGTSWGQKGYFEIPYVYLTDPDLSSDFWVVEQVE
jgi:C1A family cysteine protease